MVLMLRMRMGLRIMRNMKRAVVLLIVSTMLLLVLVMLMPRMKREAAAAGAYGKDSDHGSRLIMLVIMVMGKWMRRCWM